MSDDFDMLNWKMAPIVYFCHGSHSHQFGFVGFFWFSSEAHTERLRERQTNRRTDTTY